MTPNDLEILIHCHVSSAIHPRLDAPAVNDSIIMLVREGLVIQRGENTWMTTPKGRAHIQQIINLQYPTEQWVGANGEIIDAG